MKILTLFLSLYSFTIISMYGQTDETSNVKLLQSANVIVTNSINSTSPLNEQNVVSIIDVSQQSSTNSVAVFSHPQWTNEQIGNLTKSIYDEEGNIYLAASSMYTSESKLNSWRYGDAGGGANDLNAAGSIYRLDAYTGEVSVLTSLPQQRAMFCPIIFITFSAQRLTGPGIADIAYDYENQQILAANNEDGKIYRIDKFGTLINIYDPGLADDDSVGFAPETERITAIATSGTKVYYAGSTNTSSYIASYKIKNNQKVQANSQQLEIVLSDIAELSNPDFPITGISLRGNLLSITQSNMLNEVTKLPENLPTVILKNKASKWQLERLIDGSTNQVELSGKSNIQFAIQNDENEMPLWYAGNDIYKNNYLFNANFNAFPQMPNLLTTNYIQYEIPGLLGTIENIQFVNENVFISYNENDREDENEENENQNQADQGNQGNSKLSSSSYQIEIYPNPALTSFKIKNNSTKTVTEIYLYNLNGKLLKCNDNTNSPIDVSNFKSGVYFVKMKTVDRIYMEKILVQ